MNEIMAGASLGFGVGLLILYLCTGKGEIIQSSSICN
mgnify:CR=1 FL=1